jgi:diguanylate cyclase (GGDEF)-like protein/PAS domain S-box-containing protein
LCIFGEDEETKRVVSTLEGHPLSWHHLIEALPDGTALLDQRGVIHYVNDLLLTLTGYERDELIGRNVQMLVPPRHRDAEMLARQEHARDPSTRLIWSDGDLTVLRHDGTELSVDFALSPLAFDGKPWAVASIRDNTAQRAVEMARFEAEEHFRLAFEDNMSPMIFTDLEDRIIAANDAFCEMVGRDRDELLGHDSKVFTYPEDIGITEEIHRRIRQGATAQERYVKRYLHKDGRVIVAEISKSAARSADGRTLYFVISERDITEERALAAELTNRALHDPLTGLANRALFEDRLSHTDARILRQGGMGAVMLLDLDDFKGVNDTLGHLAGDQLLVAIARRFERVARSTDTLSRFGGDEFLYLAEGLSSVSEAKDIAQRLLDSLVEPFEIDGTRIEQRASIGIVVWDDKNSRGSDFIRDADVAMYEAKRAGKGHHVVFSPGMRQHAVGHYALVQELRHALETGELTMHYQPIIDLSTREVLGFEALMRWHHPVRGWVPPSVFIPLAEQSDLIVKLGEFALHRALHDASAWGPTRGAPAPFVTVNLSARQFHDAGMLDLVQGALVESGLAPSRLIIEITESVTLVHIAETLRVIASLNRIGVTFALDDFGTGYSSLSYLALLRPNFVKIDRSFISPTMESSSNDLLLEAILSLGNKLGGTMLAEGIETREQLENVRGLGCALGQGFLFWPAVPPDEVPGVLATPPPA